MKLNNKKAEKDTFDYINSTYNIIEVASGKCRYNYRCQLNAVHEAKKNKHKKLAMCVCTDKYKNVSIHFINFNKGVYTDNTLGEWSKLGTYYFVKWVKDEEMWEINNIFTSFRNELRARLDWWTRLTSDFEA